MNAKLILLYTRDITLPLTIKIRTYIRYLRAPAKLIVYEVIRPGISSCGLPRSQNGAVLRYRYTPYNNSEMVGREDIEATDIGPTHENLRSQPKERSFSGFLSSLWPTRAKSDACSRYIQNSGTHFRSALLSDDVIAQSELEEAAFILPENKQSLVTDRSQRNPVRAVRIRQGATTKNRRVSSGSDDVGDRICSTGDENVSTDIR